MIVCLPPRRIKWIECRLLRLSGTNNLGVSRCFKKKYPACFCRRTMCNRSMGGVHEKGKGQTESEGDKVMEWAQYTSQSRIYHKVLVWAHEASPNPKHLQTPGISKHQICPIKHLCAHQPFPISVSAPRALSCHCRKIAWFWN